MLCQTVGAANESKAIESVRTTVEAVLDVMRDETLSGPEKSRERREKMKALISVRFDFREMSRRALARHWKKRTTEEQDEFVDLFSDLLQNTYISKIEKYTDEKVNYDKEVIRKKGKYSIVRTSILSKDITIPIDYRLMRRGDKWMVYDVLVEGVSIISNYRSQYNNILSRKS
ncbi:MAG TPA: ABC transporter substrate-binding protein, partial [Nitrospirae bacterium]|nr:ABC transporter substrate-binding protein [Nitrospirota bacterium]